MQHWPPHNNAAPFTDHKDLHATVDVIKLGDVPWCQGLSTLDTIGAEAAVG